MRKDFETGGEIIKHEGGGAREKASQRQFETSCHGQTR